MPENLKQNEGIERDAGEPETKVRDKIWAKYKRTRIKRKRSNLGMMPENPKSKRKISNLGTMQENLNQKEWIESRQDDREPEIKK